MWRDTNFANVFSELKRTSQANAAEILSRSTGGRRLGFFGQGAVETAIEDIGREIHTQYLLSFTPKVRDRAGFHRLRVAVKGRPALRVRSRAAYVVP